MLDTSTRSDFCTRYFAFCIFVDIVVRRADGAAQLFRLLLTRLRTRASLIYEHLLLRAVIALPLIRSTRAFRALATALPARLGRGHLVLFPSKALFFSAIALLSSGTLLPPMLLALLPGMIRVDSALIRANIAWQEVIHVLDIDSVVLQRERALHTAALLLSLIIMFRLKLLLRVTLRLRRHGSS